MGLSKPSLLFVLVLLAVLASEKSVAIQARFLSSAQQRYANVFATLGLVCKCCDGPKGECTRVRQSLLDWAQGFGDELFKGIKCDMEETYTELMALRQKATDHEAELAEQKEQNRKMQEIKVAMQKATKIVGIHVHPKAMPLGPDKTREDLHQALENIEVESQALFYSPQKARQR
uniref:Uncharacterized protein n=1 Tax=Cannabis sativa TaxID=3483 RepID=A0A803QGI1_CANSA